MDNHEKFITNVKSLCKIKGITINTMIKDCCLNRNFIYDIVRKSTTPSIDVIVRIAKYFNVSVDYLLGIED